MGVEEGPLTPGAAIKLAQSINNSMRNPLVKRLCCILDAEEGGKILRYILDHRVFTVLILQHELMISSGIIYKTLKELQILGVISGEGSIKGQGKGRPDKIFSMAGASPSQIAAANKFHLELKSRPSDVVDTTLRELVAPIIETVLSSDRWRLGDAIPEHYFYKPFKSENGYYDEKVQRVLFESLVEKGYNILRG